MTDDMTELLHRPDRAERLDSLENHIHTAAGLARAMWLTLHSEMIGAEKRNVEGLQALASAVADHASAANYLFSKGEGE